MLSRGCELVIFDWDGTVVDSTPTIAQAILSACSDIGVQVRDPHSASYVIGLGLQDALSRVAPGLTPEQQQALVERFRHHYLSRDQSLRPFPGMTNVLQAIKSSGLPLAHDIFLKPRAVPMKRTPSLHPPWCLKFAKSFRSTPRRPW